MYVGESQKKRMGLALKLVENLELRLVKVLQVTTVTFNIISKHNFSKLRIGLEK